MAQSHWEDAHDLTLHHLRGVDVRMTAERYTEIFEDLANGLEEFVADEPELPAFRLKAEEPKPTEERVAA